MSDQFDPLSIQQLLRQLGFGAQPAPVIEEPTPVDVIETDEVIPVDDIQDTNWWRRAHTVTTVQGPSGSVSFRTKAVSGTFSGRQ